jgi:multisubunit Na+/H+ antiporter MnhB subunit
MTAKTIVKGLWMLIVTGVMSALLAWSVWSLPRSSGLTPMVSANLINSGVSNPVTAVLLNFRGYDTLLEVAVLLLALLAVWAFTGNAGEKEKLEVSIGEAQKVLTAFLVPVLILVAAYLLWTGSSKPGGAFQAGALLGGAAVLLELRGVSFHPQGIGLRLLLSIGVVGFIAVGLAMLFSGQFLQYPTAWAGALIVGIETAAMCSIGATLALLFYGRLPTGQ